MLQDSLESRYLALFQQEIEDFLKLVKSGELSPDKDGHIRKLIFKSIELSHVRWIASYLNDAEQDKERPEFILKFKSLGAVWEVHIFSTQTQTNA